MFSGAKRRGRKSVIDENVIKLTPTVVRRDQLQALVSTTPGWNTENDGLMHIRGVDDGTLYVVEACRRPIGWTACLQVHSTPMRSPRSTSSPGTSRLSLEIARARSC